MNSYAPGSISRVRLIQALDAATDFTITGEHLLLLAQVRINWHESDISTGYEGCISGAAKRPYGNSNILGDIAEIIDPAGHDAVDWDDPDAADAYWTANAARFRRLHIETFLALRIICGTSQFRSGRFTRNTMGGHVLDPPWRPAPDATVTPLCP